MGASVQASMRIKLDLFGLTELKKEAQIKTNKMQAHVMQVFPDSHIKIFPIIKPMTKSKEVIF